MSNINEGSRSEVGSDLIKAFKNHSWRGDFAGSLGTTQKEREEAFKELGKIYQGVRGKAESLERIDQNLIFAIWRAYHLGTKVAYTAAMRKVSEPSYEFLFRE